MLRLPAVLAALSLAACAATETTPDLIEVQMPAIVRAGSLVVVRGRELATARVRVAAAGGNAILELAITATDTAGVETAEGRLPDMTAWLEGARISRACLADQQNHRERGCLDVLATWTRAVTAGPVALLAGQVQHGDEVELSGHDLLLPGEGEVRAEIQHLPAESVSVAVTTRHESGRLRGWLRAGPAWLGLAPTVRQLRIRLVQTTAAAQAVGPWSAFAIELAAPSVTSQPDGALRRGALLPVAIAGVPEGAWRLHIAGNWAGAAGGGAVSWSESAPLVLPGGSVADTPAAWLDSPWFLAHVTEVSSQLGPDAAFSGQLRVELLAGADAWLGPPVAVTWRLKPTLQAIVVEMDEAFVAGLGRLGLEAFAPQVRTRTLELLTGYFAGLSVHVGLAPPPGQVEALRIAIIDVDPNGLGLLGNDNSLGKDVGNLTLDEHIAGFNPARAAAGHAAYGGVFLSGLLHFSAKLKPWGSESSAEFDNIFGPYAPKLGGTPARPGPPPAQAIEMAARLIAHTTAHEIGHALGLAAGTEAYHHLEDNPGWIMDTGQDRPFAERAGLDGAAKSIWGPVDDAYLKTILPAD